MKIKEPIVIDFKAFFTTGKFDYLKLGSSKEWVINNFPALNNSSKCMCTWAGVISIIMPGQFTVMIP